MNWGVPAVGLTTATIGGMYLAAWSAGAAARWSASGVITMKTNMALSLVLAGVALLLVEPKRTTATRRVIVMLLAAVVMLVGGLTLVEHIFQVDLGIDQLFATEQPGAVATARPNRIGPTGAVCLVLVGLGLLALAIRRFIASHFAVATAIIVLVPTVGFISGVVPLYGEAVSGIAWPTVLAFVLLVVGLHLAEGEAGPFRLLWRDDPGGRLLRRMVPAVVLAPLVLQLLQRFGAHQGWYNHNIGVGILLICFIVVMSALLWLSASYLSTEAAHGRGAEAEARWRADLLDLAHDAIMVWSPEAGIEYWNPGAQELYGYTSAEAVGRSPYDLLQAEGQHAILGIEGELRFASRWEGEQQHRTKAGRRIVVSSNLRLVRGIDGRERVLELNRDITQRKQMEIELRESSRLKDEFLGLLSHELRNPLAPITNSLYILEHAEPAGQQARRAKEVIGRQVGHLTRLINDLLEATRITRGKVQIRNTRLDLGELVRRTGEDHRELLKNAGLDFTIDIPNRRLWVNGDETRLAQVVGNLLHNARKFTPAGGKVTLSVVAVDRLAEIHVTDTGAGIGLGLIGRVFEPFVQAEQTLARTQGGLGVGLAVVKGLVELHGGWVEARSEGEGRGAEFVVYLHTVLSPAPEPADKPGKREPPHRILRVLVVEDNADAADSLADLVRMRGHQVEVARDGPTAIAKAIAAAPDLVLCDIGLPGMNGYDLARVLRSHAELEKTRLVAITGYVQPQDVQRATEAGFVGYIAKPPDPSVLEEYLS